MLDGFHTGDVAPTVIFALLLVTQLVLASNALCVGVAARLSDNDGFTAYELAFFIACPICIVCVVTLVALYLVQHRRINTLRHHQHFEPESDDLLLPSQQTLHVLLSDWSNSGSGSGKLAPLCEIFRANFRFASIP